MPTVGYAIIAAVVILVILGLGLGAYAAFKTRGG